MEAVRLQKKLLILLYDLIVYDEQISIKEDSAYVRKQIANGNPEFIEYIGMLLNTDTENKKLYDHQHHDKRSHILKIMEYLVYVNNELLVTL